MISNESPCSFCGEPGTYAEHFSRHLREFGKAVIVPGPVK